MPPPRVSLIWLNYNSAHILPLIEESLRAMAKVDYINCEIIIVDNASMDGSFEFIQRLIKKISAMKSLAFKIVRNERNLGFVGGMNSGFSARDSGSKYVALVNNDAVIAPDSISLLIKEMENDLKIGAAQGIISNIDGTLVDSAGVIVDELLNPRFVLDQDPIRRFSTIDVSYVEGTFPAYRVSAVETFLKGHMFIPEGFMYSLEDALNGLMLWNRGYRCVVFPYVVAKHYRRATIKKYQKNLHEEYHQWKNRIALLAMTDSRYKGGLERVFEKAVIFGYRAWGRSDEAHDITQGISDGKILGDSLKVKYGFEITLKKCPLIRLGDMGANFRLANKILRDRSRLYRIPYV